MSEKGRYGGRSIKKEAAGKRTQKTGEAAAGWLAEGKATPQELVDRVDGGRDQGEGFREGRGRPPGFPGRKGVGE
jgi:hypothetical protein